MPKITAMARIEKHSLWRMSGCFSHLTTLTVRTLRQMKQPIKATAVDGTGASTSPTTMLVCGSSMSKHSSTQPIQTIAQQRTSKPPLDGTSLTVKMEQKSNRVSMTLVGLHSCGRLNITTGSPTHLVFPRDCTSCSSRQICHT